MRQLSFADLDSGFAGEIWFDQILDQLGVDSGPGWPDRFGLAVQAWLTEREPIPTLSLFSGGGGLDIAFSQVGFHPVQMVEIERKYTETLAANAAAGGILAGSAVHCQDIRDFQTDVAVDFIIGGPPCQTFSAAGRRAAGVPGTSDPRGILFEEYVRLLSELQPHGFLFENVYGIVGANGGRDWAAIQTAFADVGYRISHRILDSADYGVPQHRERLVIVGLRNGEFLFPYPTHGPDSIGGYPYYTAGEAVADLKLDHLPTGIGGKYGHLLNDIPLGLNYSFYTEKMGHPNPVFGWRSKFSDFLYKADPSMPVRTIKAQGGQYTGPFSWNNRPFTVDELKRLQTFPDAYAISGSRQSVIEQIGNSVPPQLGRMLALSILDQVFEVRPPFPMHYMEPQVTLGFRKRKRRLTQIYQDKARVALESVQVRREPVYHVGTEVSYLSANFDWTDRPGPDSVRVPVTYDLNDGVWSLSVGDDRVYHIELTPNPMTGWVLPVQRVILAAEDFTPAHFTALWKAFEDKMATFYGVADLVQLGAYYQYTSRLEARMQMYNRPPDDLWRVLGLIVAGVGVAQQRSGTELASRWQIELIHDLGQRLRRMGYEVRNHNTNPQIPAGHYLVPYRFPTLTPRSVQLRKSLG